MTLWSVITSFTPGRCNYSQWTLWWFGYLMQIFLWTKQRCWRTSFGTSSRNLRQPLGYFGRKRSPLILRIQLPCLIMRRSWRQLERSKIFFILLFSDSFSSFFWGVSMFSTPLSFGWAFGLVQVDLALNGFIFIVCAEFGMLSFNDLWFIYWPMFCLCRAGLFSESQRIQFTIEEETQDIPDARTFFLKLQEIRTK